MASFTYLFPKLLSKEGLKYTNDPLDNGGPTKMGITLATWKKFGYDINKDGQITEKDVMLISVGDAEKIAKRQYWDYFLADQIKSQQVAEMIVDFGFNSGVVTAAIQVQKLLAIKADGVFGPITIGAINKVNPQLMFEKIKQARLKYVHEIVENNPTQVRFIKGWVNRINSFDSPDSAKKNVVIKLGVTAAIVTALWQGFSKIS